MRKLKLQVQLSVDGFIAGPNGEMDWMTWNWDDGLKQFVGSITDPIDCIVLGRKLAEGFIPTWAGIAAEENHPEQAAGRKFTDTPKYVFTKTLHFSAWENTAVVNGDLAEEITKLKNQDGGDIMVYGGASFVSSLIKAGLVDELYLFVNPVILGAGMPIFDGLAHTQVLKPVKTIQFECGVVLLHYTVGS